MPAMKASAHATAQTHRGSLEIIGYKVRTNRAGEYSGVHGEGFIREGRNRAIRMSALPLCGG